MDRFGLIGFPVAHSLSPQLFNAAYGGRFSYDLCEYPDFEDAWGAFINGGYRAVNVTAPFKEQAFQRADYASEICAATEAANILLKTEDGIKAFNTDVLAVKAILSRFSDIRTAAVIGYGGAGKAAFRAVCDMELEARLYRHDEIRGGACADIIIYTLPCKIEAAGRLRCRHLLEANYKNPCLKGMKGYISGEEWLIQQALTGFRIMTGQTPSAEAMSAIIEK